MGKKSIVKGAIILTVAGIITRILGFGYRIYMSNIIGAEGMGLYQLIMPLYSLAWSISCSGFTTTVSKLIAQEKAKRESGNMGRILKQSIFITAGIGLALGILLFFFSGYVSIYILKDPRTALSLKILSLCFPFMAAGTCIRGYFFGLQENLVPAINQVLEQCVRMTVIYFLAGFFIPKGLEYALAVAVIGIFAEELFSLLFVIFAYKRNKIKNAYTKKPNMSRGDTFRILMAMAMPLTLNRVTGSLLSWLENMLIPQRLQLFGLTQKEALSQFGQITGMAMPLIFFPSAFLISLSISLVPAISEANATKNYNRISYTVSKTILFASIIGMGASAIFIVFSRELGMVIFKQDLSQMLLLLGVMCPFMYIQVVLSGILNGLGAQVFLFRNSLISSVINIAFIYFLVPEKGVSAFILGWFVSLIVTCSMEIDKINKDVDIKLEFTKWFLLPLLSALASGITIKYFVGEFIFSQLGKVLGLVAAGSALVLIYMVCIVLTGCFSMGDIQELFIKKRR